MSTIPGRAHNGAFVGEHVRVELMIDAFDRLAVRGQCVSVWILGR